MVEVHMMVKGRIAELKVAARLLEEGHEVYAPLVDDRGIDFLVRKGDGSVDEIQVKSLGEGRWFQVTTKDSPEVAARPRRWVLCVDGHGTTWVMPARVFFDAASVSRNEKGIFTYDLDLDVTRKGNAKTNADLLAQYREAWKLLRD